MQSLVTILTGDITVSDQVRRLAGSNEKRKGVPFSTPFSPLCFTLVFSLRLQHLPRHTLSMATASVTTTTSGVPASAAMATTTSIGMAATAGRAPMPTTTSTARSVVARSSTAASGIASVAAIARPRIATVAAAIGRAAYDRLPHVELRPR